MVINIYINIVKNMVIETHTYNQNLAHRKIAADFSPLRFFCF